MTFTAATLRPELARIVAENFLLCGDWEQTKQRIIGKEAAIGKAKLLDLLSNLSDPTTRMIPRLVQRNSAPDTPLRKSGYL
jgi:hypothetical protein